MGMKIKKDVTAMKTNPKMHQTTNTDMLDDYTVSRKTDTKDAT